MGIMLQTFLQIGLLGQILLALTDFVGWTLIILTELLERTLLTLIILLGQTFLTRVRLNFLKPCNEKLCHWFIRK